MGDQDGTSYLLFANEAERLWSILTGNHSDEFYDDADETAEELARFGESAAAIVLRDVRAAVESEEDVDEDVKTVAGYRDDEYSDEAVLMWGNPRLDVDRLGGEDNIPRIRKMLKEIGGRSAYQSLLLLSIVDDLDATGDSERILAAVDDSEVIRVLVRRLASPEPEVARAAAVALEVRGSGAIPTLVAALMGSDARVVVTASAVLGRIGHPDAVIPLLSLLAPGAAVSDEWLPRANGRRGTFQTARAAVAQALSRIGDRRALDTLVGTIGNHDEWTSEAAIEAVVTLGGDPRAVVPILRAELPTAAGDRDCTITTGSRQPRRWGRRRSTRCWRRLRTPMC